MTAPTPGRIAIVDVTDESTFALLPPCADPGFDHRSCDYWEDADRGSKAIRLDWIEPGGAVAPEPPPRAAPANPFLADLEERRANPFAVDLGGGGAGVTNPLLPDDDALDDNPFAPRRAPRPTVADTAPRKLRLLARGLGVAGSYAKVLLSDEVPAAYCQFGPLTAYPRAQRTRDLYPALPGCAAAGGHHLHRVDRRGAWRRTREGARRGGLRGPRGTRFRGGRDVSRDRGATGRDERSHPGVLGIGRVRHRGAG